MTATEEQRAHRRLVEQLTESGALSADWRPVFEAVPRAEFIPETVWVQGEGGVLVTLRRSEDPRRWLELAYADDAVITQVDDGQVAPDGTGRRISSSASMPTVVAQMLAHCAARPGQRVLEIGTGTGYNAALLAHKLRAGNVVTIEIDSDLAQTARSALKTAPWGTDYYNGGLLVLTVTEEHTAVGCLVDKASFMTLRHQRFSRPELTLTAHDDAHAARSTTDIHPAEIANAHVAFDACIALAIRVPQCAMSYTPPQLDADGEGILWLIDALSGSWARLHHHPDHDGPYRVLQSGPRRLWDEVHTSYHWWLDAGRPPADRWRFTITAEGQHIQLLDR